MEGIGVHAVLRDGQTGKELTIVATRHQGREQIGWIGVNGTSRIIIKLPIDTVRYTLIAPAPRTNPFPGAEFSALQLARGAAALLKGIKPGDRLELDGQVLIFERRLDGGYVLSGTRYEGWEVGQWVKDGRLVIRSAG